MTADGLSSLNSGLENARILQAALDRGGDIEVDEPGVFRVAGTLLISDHTHIKFSPGVYIERESVPGRDGNFLLNRGALTRTYNEDISVEGLRLYCCGVERSGAQTNILGLRGHVAFMCVRDLVIRDVEIPDLQSADYGIQISDFENVTVERIRVEGLKDGIHFGPGRGFTVRHCVFRTFDDAIALNGSDYAVSNPTLGWIEDGLIEDCCDLNDQQSGSYFARLLSGSWREWYSGMEIRHSDAVVHNGILYRAVMQPDWTTYISVTAPSHNAGAATLDGINWVKTQNDAALSAGCRNITFRNIYLQKPRPKTTYAFAVTMDKSEYLRSYYPGAESCPNSGIVLENVHTCPGLENLMLVNAPLTDLTLIDCECQEHGVVFREFREDGLKYCPVELKLEGGNIRTENPGGTEVHIVRENC